MTDNHHFDENLKRMLQSALEAPRPEFQEKLRREVLAEVSRERVHAVHQKRQLDTTTHRERTPGCLGEALPRHTALPVRVGTVRLWELMRDSLRGQLKWGLIAGAAAIMVLFAWVNLRPGDTDQLMGRVNCLYGQVGVQVGEETLAISGTTELKSGQRISTESGSRAELVLRDQSRISPDPRTAFRIAQSAQGPRIQLETGRINLEAARQAAGKFIVVEASGARVKILGTKLDIRVVQKPSAERQTVVRVQSGRVEMASGGQSVMLLPGTVGVADENQPPVRSSLTFEVNELIRLLEQTSRLARQSGRAYEAPAIIDFTSDTIWTVVSSQTLQASGPGRLELRLRYPAFRAKAYTLDGAEIPTEGTGTILHLEIGSMGMPQVPDFLILKVPGVRGILTDNERGEVEFALPRSGDDSLRLLQLHLAESARVESLIPAPQSSVLEKNRLIVTVAAAVRLPQVHD